MHLGTLDMQVHAHITVESSYLACISYSRTEAVAVVTAAVPVAAAPDAIVVIAAAVAVSIAHLDRYTFRRTCLSCSQGTAAQ